MTFQLLVLIMGQVTTLACGIVGWRATKDRRVLGHALILISVACLWFLVGILHANALTAKLENP